MVPRTVVVSRTTRLPRFVQRGRPASTQVTPPPHMQGRSRRTVHCGAIQHPHTPCSTQLTTHSQRVGPQGRVDVCAEPRGAGGSAGDTYGGQRRHRPRNTVWQRAQNVPTEESGEGRPGREPVRTPPTTFSPYCLLSA
jgi:hypothetical protein